MVLELNASGNDFLFVCFICTKHASVLLDDRGIGIVRGQILNFASTRTIYNGGYKEKHQV
jgi:hypothetical protein